MATILDALQIATCIVSYGKEASFAGAMATVSIRVTPVAPGIGQLRLTWAATGDIFSSFSDTTSGDPGLPGLIVLPQTGQTGFRHGSSTFKDWVYQAVVTSTLADGQQLTRSYNFQIPAGTTTLDLDMLDEDGPITLLPAVAPVPTVTSVNGLTGAITIAGGGVNPWAANTLYTAYQVVVGPDGTLQQAKTAFTSGTTFVQANWAPLTVTPASVAATYLTYDGTSIRKAGVAISANASEIGRLPGFNQPPASLLQEAAPAAANIATFSGDDFSGTAGTTLAGRSSTLGAAQTWTVITGTWQLDGSGAVAPITNADGLIAVTTLPASNRFQFTVQVTTAWKGALGSTAAAIIPSLIVRYVDASNFWYLNASPNLGTVTLYQVKAGTHRVMATVPVPAGITDGTAITLRADILGRDITCFINGIELYCFQTVDIGMNSAKVGIRQGLANNYATPAKFSNFRVTTYAGPKWNFPCIDAAPSNQVLTRGPGAWETADINNPNVFWDPAAKRWTMYYSGYDGSMNPIGQGLGLASAPTLDGAWTKDSRNPVVPAATTNVENGGLVYVYGRWLRCSDNGAGVSFWTSPDLVTWTQLATNGLITTSMYDAFLRVGQNGLLELWYGFGFPNAKIYRATSIDGGSNWSTPIATLGAPPFFAGTQYRGNGEPSVFGIPGKEGVEYIVFADGQEQDGKGYIVAAFTIDGGQTWHWRNVVGGSGSGFDSYQKFDSYPVYAEGAFHLFHGAAPKNGNILNIDITIGRMSVQWGPYPSALSSAPAPYGLVAPFTMTNSVAPTVTGSTPIGSVLTASTGTWTPAPDSYKYQWQRAGVAISGATSTTYTTVMADSGLAVTCTITAVKAGYLDGTAVSNTIVPGALTNSVAPTLSGTAAVGSTLTVSTGTWTPTPDTYVYQWQRAGVAISGATSTTYTLVTADSGQAIGCVVTASKTGYSNVSVSSSTVTATSSTRDPAAISGMSARYRADSLTLNSGDAVASWNDTSGNGYTATNSGAAATKPTFQTNVLNGKPSVRFATASNQNLVSAAPAGSATFAQTVFAVVIPASLTTNRTIRGSSVNGGLQVRIASSKLNNVAQQLTDLGSSTTTLTAGTAVAGIATFTNASGGGSTWRVNGTAAGSSTVGANGTIPTATTVIGLNASSTSEGFDGDILEIIVFSRILTASEQAVLDSYAQDRYGITVSDYS